jgi:O-antigen ligase
MDKDSKVGSMEQLVVEQDDVGALINRAATRLCTFLLAAGASFTLTLSAYLEAFRATHVGAVLLGLIALHLLWHRRVIWPREFSIYACLVGYMFITLLWARDVDLAMNTLVPAANFVFVMIFFGSLIGFHNVRAVLVGALFGFMVGAALYTVTQGFPFSYPDQFSYNAIAGMYLFGLFIALMCSCFKRSYVLLPVIAAVIMLHIVATTSIKANLGIVLGLIAAGIMYSNHFGRLLRRQIFILTALVFGLGFAVASNHDLAERVIRGLQRVTIGAQVLQTREDVSGYSGFGERDYWKQMGIEGWKQNPVFGYGAEAFRDDYGVTSHSTPIDLLYNFGLIGLILFYAVFASLIWRLLQLDNRRTSSQRALILAGIVCYAFVSLSGTVHYNALLASFIGMSAALLTSQGGATASTLDARHQAAPIAAVPFSQLPDG